MTLSRRQFLGSAGAAGATAALAACSGFSTKSSSSGAGSDTVTFTTWGTDAELAGFRSAIARFQQQHKGAKVQLNAVPYDQMFTNIDAQLQAGNPPDVFRVPYYTFGSYAGRGQLLDLSTHLAGGVSGSFTKAAWSAVQHGGKPYGVPHHTDTTAILYNKQALATAGVTSVPTKLADAWTWEEFDALGSRLRGALPANKYPFALNWQGNGVTRWLTWLFEANGRFLGPDLTTAAIDSAAGTAALDFTRSFFTKRYVPKNDSVTSATLAQDIWFSQTSAIGFAGAFLLPDAAKALKFDWGATFAPRRQRSASDFGGNALVATAATKQPDLAAAFLQSLTERDAMKSFCEGASLLPTRTDLVGGDLRFAVRPDLAPVFVGQASSVRPEDSGQVASPSMSKIITTLKSGLDGAFVGGKSTAATLQALQSGIAAAVQ